MNDKAKKNIFWIFCVSDQITGATMIVVFLCIHRDLHAFTSYFMFLASILYTSEQLDDEAFSSLCVLQ
jgi:hypothetical protein